MSLSPPLPHSSTSASPTHQAAVRLFLPFIFWAPLSFIPSLARHLPLPSLSAQNLCLTDFVLFQISSWFVSAHFFLHYASRFSRCMVYFSPLPRLLLRKPPYLLHNFILVFILFFTTSYHSTLPLSLP